MLSRGIEDIKQTETELGIKNYNVQMKNPQDTMNGRLDTAEEKISEYEGIAIETTHMQHKKQQNKATKTNTASVSCATTYILGHKTNFNIFKRIHVIQYRFSLL